MSYQMAYQFHEVDIFAFDIHTTTRPLLSPEIVQQDLRFLTNAKSYQQQYLAGKAVNTATFTIRPITKRSLNRNRFWREYQEVWVDDGSPDFWRLQIPFLCDPGLSTLRLNGRNLGFQGSVRPIILVSALGWSTNLHIRLHGQIEPSQLRGFVGKLRDHETKLFQVDAKAQSLSDTFKFFSNRLRKELYAPTRSPGDVMKVPRYLIVSIAQFTGPVRYYRSAGQGDPMMSDADRALMYGLLYGRQFKVEEWMQKDQEKSVLLTSFKSPSFALTDFHHGSLLFMQESAQKGSTRRAALQCFASNVGSSSMMTLALLGFYEDSARYSKDSPTIRSIRDDIKTTLQELSWRYKNAVCRTFYLKYGPLQKLLSDG